MTDQVKLPEQRTLVPSSNKRARQVYPEIHSIINGDGDHVKHDGVSTNRDLSFVGSAKPDQFAEIQDFGIPAHPPVTVDSSGHFSAFLPEQSMGPHEYSVRTTDGEESAPWRLEVISGLPSIRWVAESGGEIIENGGSTFHSSLRFEGDGAPSQTVKLLDNGNELQTLNVGWEGRWSAFVENLQTGSHHFIAQATDGQESNEWIVLIKPPAPLSIQFVLGQENLQLLKNHDTTADRKVTLTGTANPKENGWIVDYRGELLRFEADEHGIYSATIEDLEVDKAHTFRAVSDTGRLSNPWAITVIGSKLR